MSTFFGSNRACPDYLAFFSENQQNPFIRKAVLDWFAQHGYEVHGTPAHEYFVSQNGAPLRDEPFTVVQLQSLLIQLEQMGENPLLKFYYFYWIGGNVTGGLGTDVAEAASNCGISSGALRALELYSEGFNPCAVYDTQNKCWVLKKTPCTNVLV